MEIDSYAVRYEKRKGNKKKKNEDVLYDISEFLSREKTRLNQISEKLCQWSCFSKNLTDDDDDRIFKYGNTVFVCSQVILKIIKFLKENSFHKFTENNEAQKTFQTNEKENGEMMDIEGESDESHEYDEHSTKTITYTSRNNYGRPKRSN